MRIIQTALLLQITGFLLSSVTLALVEIDAIKKMADSIKNRIVVMAHDHPWSTGDRIAIKFLITATSHILAETILETRSHNKTINPGTLLQVGVSAMRDTWTVFQLFFIFIAFYSARLLQVSAIKLSGNRVITRGMIVSGVILLFVGLILEFFSV